MNFFKKQPTPKEAAMAAKREARREVRVSRALYLRSVGLVWMVVVVECKLLFE